MDHEQASQYERRAAGWGSLRAPRASPAARGHGGRFGPCGDQRRHPYCEGDPVDGLPDRSFLQRTGHDVVLCHGPDDGQLCRLLAGTGCELVERAHGIVFALDLASLQRIHDGTTPVVRTHSMMQLFH